MRARARIRHRFSPRPSRHVNPAGLACRPNGTAAAGRRQWSQQPRMVLRPAPQADLVFVQASMQRPHHQQEHCPRCDGCRRTATLNLRGELVGSARPGDGWLGTSSTPRLRSGRRRNRARVAPATYAAASNCPRPRLPRSPSEAWTRKQPRPVGVDGTQLGSLRQFAETRPDRPAVGSQRRCRERKRIEGKNFAVAVKTLPRRTAIAEQKLLTLHYQHGRHQSRHALVAESSRMIHESESDAGTREADFDGDGHALVFPRHEKRGARNQSRGAGGACQ